ncbi:c-type cytochrome [Nitrosovibrio tenuis]|uniref:Cytochrome c5 n=1 Tax=Nitrosovibrio tenuis TaxID=1233 RepID=A0A1H7RH35_9PROT|nr:c-type cytochrome [Nitrosovibrio tenuis]SEL59429.1 Cytochrome c5 [Nitrosovibrio tenuis]
MSGTEDEEHSSAIKTPKQLITVLVAAFVFPVLIIMLLGHFATGNPPIDRDNPAFSDQAVAKRLRPVGSLVLATDSPQAEVKSAPMAGQAMTAPATSMAASGQGDKITAIYTSSCAACHATGAAGAPKLGDKAAWAPRIKAGAESLYNSALKGKNAMPPKGGNASLSDTDVKALVDYMVSQSK